MVLLYSVSLHAGGNSVNKLIVVGAGGCGRDVMHWASDCAAAGAPWQPYGFIDDNPNAFQGLKQSLPLLGSIGDWCPKEEQRFVVAIADPASRRRVVASLTARGAIFSGLVHPTARVVSTATLGEGVILSPYVVVSDNAKVGDFVFVNLHSALGHDSITEEYCTICSFCDITGGVKLEQGVYVGSRVTITPQTIIGEEAFLCAGSVVLQRVLPRSKVLGNPAKPFAM